MVDGVEEYNDGLKRGLAESVVFAALRVPTLGRAVADSESQRVYNGVDVCMKIDKLFSQLY